MKGFVEKQAVLDYSKSLAIHGWLRDFNVGVPCTVQSSKKNLKEGMVFVEMRAPLGISFSVQVPEASVFVFHKWFKHTIRLPMLPQALEVMRGSSMKGLTHATQIGQKS